MLEKVYKNKFEQALELSDNPKEFINVIRYDKDCRKNQRIMSLVKILLTGFRRFFGYAVVSGLKGLNPFKKDAKMVEEGYYDFRNTAEFKSVSKYLCKELGIPDDYMEKETRDKYVVVKNVLLAAEDNEAIKNLELTSEGFFTATDRDWCLDVFSKDTFESFKEYAKESKYEVDADNCVFGSFGTDVVINTESAVVRSFMEKYKLGRGYHKKIALEPDVSKESIPYTDEVLPKADEFKEEPKEGQLFMSGDFQMVRHGDSVMVAYYKGENDKDVTIPEKITVAGKEYPVTEIYPRAFRYCVINSVSINASALDAGKFNTMCLLNKANQLTQVNWTGLTELHDRALEENKQWAQEQIEKDAKTEKEPDVDKQHENKEPETKEQTEPERRRGSDIDI